MEDKELCEKIINQVEEMMKNISEEGINSSNINTLGCIIDMHKDLKNEKYWEEKIMRYRTNYGRDNYGNYGNYSGDYRGNYGRDNYREIETRQNDRYNARGYDTKYRGEEYLGNMIDSYHDYSYGRENYGHDQDTMESYKYMLKSFKDYFRHLKQEASSPEETRLLQETAREISEM